MSRYGRSEHSTMVNLNENLLCAIDVETTGLDPFHHDIIQIAILPLDAHIEPLRTVLPFYMEMQPKRPENVDPNTTKVHRLKIAELMQRAIDPWKCLDLFEEWFKKLGLPLNKKIVPLAHNWCFDRDFVREWVGGPKSFEYFFDSRYRDTMAIAAYMNDRADMRVDKFPYPKISLSYCCNMHEITNLKAHDALQDCVATAKLYQKFLKMFIPTL